MKVLFNIVAVLVWQKITSKAKDLAKAKAKNSKFVLEDISRPRTTTLHSSVIRRTILNRSGCKLNKGLWSWSPERRHYRLPLLAVTSMFLIIQLKILRLNNLLSLWIGGGIFRCSGLWRRRALLLVTNRITLETDRQTDRPIIVRNLFMWHVIRSCTFFCAAGVKIAGDRFWQAKSSSSYDVRRRTVASLGRVSLTSPPYVAYCLLTSRRRRRAKINSTEQVPNNVGNKECGSRNVCPLRLRVHSFESVRNGFLSND